MVVWRVSGVDGVLKDGCVGQFTGCMKLLLHHVLRFHSLRQKSRLLLV